MGLDPPVAFRNSGKFECYPWGLLLAHDCYYDATWAIWTVEIDGEESLTKPWGKNEIFVVPDRGFEPLTNGLQNRCSTTELSRRGAEFY